MADAMAPVKVSPLIRTARWTLLGLGILYGTTRWNYLHRKEEKYRAYLRDTKPIRDAEEAAKAKERAALESTELKKQGLDLGM